MIAILPFSRKLQHQRQPPEALPPRPQHTHSQLRDTPFLRLAQPMSLCPELTTSPTEIARPFGKPSGHLGATSWQFTSPLPRGHSTPPRTRYNYRLTASRLFTTATIARQPRHGRHSANLWNSAKRGQEVSGETLTTQQIDPTDISGEFCKRSPSSSAAHPFSPTQSLHQPTSRMAT